MAETSDKLMEALNKWRRQLLGDMYVECQVV